MDNTLKTQLADIALYGSEKQPALPSLLYCQEVEIVEAWIKTMHFKEEKGGEEFLMPAQVLWIDGVDHITHLKECLFVAISDTNTGVVVLKGKRTYKSPRLLNDSDVLFEVLPI